MTPPNAGLSTRAVHGGEARPNPYHALPTPIVQTSTYGFADTAALLHYHEERMTWDKARRWDYARAGNVTVQAAEGKLAELEGGHDAVLLGSGMAAVATTLLMLLQPGDHIVATAECYRRVRLLTQQFLPRWGVRSSVIAMGDYDALEAAITPQTRLIFSETPTNPFMRVLDLPRVATIARRHKVRTVLDSTFATPINLRPLEHGIDVVIHSATKYLGGHNDLLAGAVIGNSDVIALVRDGVAALGAVADPHCAYLLLRGLKTLALRVERQNASALALARLLEEHPAVARVWYPGLPSHPDHAAARAQMVGFGGVVTFELAGDRERTSRFVDAVRIPTIGPSFGGVESLIEQPALMSFYDHDAETRRAWGISDALVRLAVGIEDTADLVADLTQALAALD